MVPNQEQYAEGTADLRMNDVSTCVLCLLEELVFHDNEVINNPHGPMDCEGSALSSVFWREGNRPENV